MWWLWLILGFLIGFFVGVQPKISRTAEGIYNATKYIK